MAGVMVAGLAAQKPSEIALICGCPRVSQQGRRRKSSTGAAAKVTPNRYLSKEDSHSLPRGGNGRIMSLPCAEVHMKKTRCWYSDREIGSTDVGLISAGHLRAPGVR